nr:class I SAM-dependent methyltransferase [Bacteroidota bacterium]
MKKNLETYKPGEAFIDIGEYDAGIRQIIPYYDLMLDIITKVVPAETNTILELGSGTGELTMKLLAGCKQAKFLCIDYSGRMIQFMKNKITTAGHDSRMEWVQTDIENIPLSDNIVLKTGSVGACVSSLALHHLTDESKGRLISHIYTLLRPGGHFWIADTVLPRSGEMTGYFMAEREQWLSDQGLTREMMAQKMLHDKLFKQPDNHNPGTIEKQLGMFEMAGFRTTEVLWKYFGLAVFGGIK